MIHIPLSELCVDARPGFACGGSDEHGIIQVRMNNVSTEGRLSFETVRRVPKSAVDLDRFELRAGDILFNATNSPELVGKSAIFSAHGEPVVYSNHFLRIRVDRERSEPAYVSSWLQALRSNGVFTAMCKQWVNQAAVSTERLMALDIPLPKIAEQRRIAAILDQADALRAKRRAALEQQDKLASSLFVSFFGGAPGRPATPPLIALAALILDGPQNGLYKPSTEYGTGTNILRIDAFYDGVITKLDRL